MKTKHIVIYVDVLERCHFFKKFYQPLLDAGFHPLFLTSRYSVEQELRKINAPVSLLKKLPISSLFELPDYSKSLSVLNRYHTLSEAKALGNSVYEHLHKLHNTDPIDMFWIWNGTTTIAKTLTAFSKDHHITCRYFEVGNFDPYIFVDTQGTNAASYLYRHPEILDHLTPDRAQYSFWLKAYRQKQNLPKQAANRTRIPWRALLDYIGYVQGYLREDRRSAFRLLLKRIKNRAHPALGHHISLDTPFLFVPLQVSNDSQLKLYSRYSNLELLAKAVDIAAEKRLSLVVKIHPAEDDLHAIEKIMTLSREKKFLVASNPTQELITRASLVVVNNSTVGLEAQIAEKEVHIYGEAFYKQFDQRRLQNYLLSYLIPADYFGDAPISPESFKAIINRDLWSQYAKN